MQIAIASKHIHIINNDNDEDNNGNNDYCINNHNDDTNDSIYYSTNGRVRSGGRGQQKMESD